jgi:hypothetical protein
MILILMVFTYSRSDSKKNLLCWKIILTITKPNINYHSQCDDHIHYYNMSTWIKKSFSKKAHKTNESLKLLLITQWEFINGLKTSTHAVCNSNFIHPSLNGIPFLCNHLRNSTQSFMRFPMRIPFLCNHLRICKHLAGVAPFWEPYRSTLKKSLNIYMHKFIISQISTCKYN